MDVSKFVQEQQVDELEALVEAALLTSKCRRERIELLQNQIERFTHNLITTSNSGSCTRRLIKQIG
jgi:uncharacterized small protein (DUF1192 family)